MQDENLKLQTILYAFEGFMMEWMEGLTGTAVRPS